MTRKKWNVVILIVTAITVVALAYNYYYVSNKLYKVNVASLIKVDSIKTLKIDFYAAKQGQGFIRFEDFERRKFEISQSVVTAMGNNSYKFKNANLTLDVLTDTQGFKTYTEKNTEDDIKVCDVIIEGQRLISIESLNEENYKQHIAGYFFILLFSGIFITYCFWRRVNTN
jgi:hypothetical protein